MPISDDEEMAVQKKELRIQRQIGLAAGLFEEDVTVRTLLESLAEGCVITGNTGNILFVSARAARMFGYTKKELFGKHHSVLIPERFRKAHRDHEENFIGAPRIRPMGQLLDLVGLRLDGSEFPLEISLGFIETRYGVLVLALVSDTSLLHDEINARIRIAQTLHAENAERLGVEAELHKKELLLLQQSRAAAMGEMIGNIAHHWRQPLNTLGLLAQELPMTFKRGEFSAQYLESHVRKMLKTINHMSRTIDDFRYLAIPSTEKEDVRILEILEKTLSVLEDSLTAHEIKTAVIPTCDPVVSGYSNELAQVLLHILTNARDAFASQKVISPTITIEICTREDRCVVTISDNAGGIPEDLIERIFDPYFTTRGPHQGRGLGLFTSKKIVEEMGGTLSVCNAGSGAQFRLEIKA